MNVIRHGASKDTCDTRDVVYSAEDNAHLEEILAMLKDKIGHDFSLYKPNTIFRRIQKRLHATHIDNIANYIYYLRQHTSEIESLLKALLINVTHFFRDAEAFEVLKKELLEKLANGTWGHDGLRIWVAGCSTGEEAYSLAMIVQECKNILGLAFDVRIFATDADADAIDTARVGVFSKSIEKHVSIERLNLFFTKKNNHYKVNREIRKTITFAVQNLIDDPPFTKLHVLSCRNVLIYLKHELQKKILPLLSYSLYPQGLLFLGPSESVGRASDFFHVIDKRWKLYEHLQVESRLPAIMEVSLMHQLPEISSSLHHTEKLMHHADQKISNLVKNVLVENYSPACIVINEKGDIVCTYGRPGKFLEFPPGDIRLHLLDMIHVDLKAKLQAAIRKATQQHTEISLNSVRFTQNNEHQYINLKIRPITQPEPPSKSALTLIIIEEIETIETAREVTIPSKKSFLKRKSDKKIIQLEQTLQHAKDSLQITIEELETANEELKSSNEELQSTNEELQSLHEEATTVNSELESCIEQLASANDDNKNMLDNTEIATILLDKDLCVRRFTQKATELIHLIPTDIGRPISHLVSNLNYEQLVEDARTVLNTLEPIMTDRIDKKGHWHTIKIAPYRSVMKLIDGVMITFSNVHSQKTAEHKLKTVEKELKKLEAFNHQLLDMMDNATVFIDKNANIILANVHFLNRFSVTSEKIVGHALYTLSIPWDQEQLKHFIEKMLQGKALSGVLDLKLASQKTACVTAHKLSTSTLLLIID